MSSIEASSAVFKILIQYLHLSLEGFFFITHNIDFNGSPEFEMHVGLGHLKMPSKDSGTLTFLFSTTL